MVTILLTPCSPCQTRRTVVMSVERSATKGQSPRLNTLELQQSCAKPSKYSSVCHIFVKFPEQREVTNHKNLAQMALFLEIQNNDVDFYSSFIFFFGQIQSMKNPNSPASRLRVEPTAVFGEGAGLSNILLRPNRKPVFFLSGTGKCFSTRVWNTPLQTWGRKTCKKTSLICRGRNSTYFDLNISEICLEGCTWYSQVPL